MKKPLCLELIEAENELNKAVEAISTAHNLPCYLLAPMVSNLAMRLEDGKRREIEEAKKSYEAEVKTDVCGNA